MGHGAVWAVFCASAVTAQAASPPGADDIYVDLPDPGLDAEAERPAQPPTSLPDHLEELPEPDLDPEPPAKAPASPPVVIDAPSSQDAPTELEPEPEPSTGPDATDEPVAVSSPPKKGKKKKNDRKWIKHEVIAGDRLDTIAARYGVTRSGLIRWNKLDPDKAMIRVGQKLRVYAKFVPPPRRQITYIVKKGDTWPGIAKKFGVDQNHLRRWNKKVPRRFKYGTALVIWVEGKEESGEDGGGGDGKVSTSPLPTVSVRGNGYSVGQPNRGKLVNGVQLPENDELYDRRDPDLLYGTSHTIDNLQLAIARWRRDYDYDGKLVVSAISKRGGGRFRPHSSHQTGRDVDIRMPVKAGIDHTMAQNSSEVDWDATWALVRSLLETEQVQYIFLSYNRQRRLYSAAKRAGVSSKQLDAWIQYPRKPKTNNGIVRHAEGHTSHIHVRFTCGPGENRCVSY